MPDITGKYSPIESWVYERVFADATLDSVSTVIDRLGAAVSVGDSVLDVGCGGGQLAVRVVGRYQGVRVTGVDLTPEQIARATKRAHDLPSSMRERLQFHTASALDLPFDDESFDAVISVTSIMNWPDRTKGIEEIVRVLKAGGPLALVELDRGCHLHDAREHLRSSKLPPPLRTPFLGFWRTYVAGQGLDLDDARKAIAGQPVTSIAVERISGTPFLMIAGTKSR